MIFQSRTTSILGVPLTCFMLDFMNFEIIDNLTKTLRTILIPIHFILELSFTFYFIVAKLSLTFYFRAILKILF
jgi:hypothetical protein